MIVLSLLLALTYLLFLLWLRNGLTTINKSSNVNYLQDTVDSPKVSVIVAVRNEATNIATLLEHLLNQSYPREQYEIVIADDGSTDDTNNIITSIAKNESRLKYLKVDDIPAGWAPKKWALSQGVKISSGEILIFTDADCTMDTEWITQIINCFADRQIRMVAAPSPLQNGNSMWNRMLLLDSIGQDALTAGGLSRNLPLTISGRNLAIRRTAFDSVKGYEGIQSFISGDDDLMMHKIAHHGLKLHFCLLSEAEVKSPPPSNFKAFVQQRLRFASKGKSYFNLPFVSHHFRWILILIYLTNLGVVLGQAMTLLSSNQTWLLPWFLKISGDGILIYKYTSTLRRPFDIPAFLLSEIWHSLYVVVLGALGSFLPVFWKGRKENIKIA
ncbi:MAG: glycosyltransferase [Candidatus Marinimicrobia bacterium]|nr:glycosyltransferase [Candidatus Neomarinimicrobiota bacterium]